MIQLIDKRVRKVREGIFVRWCVAKGIYTVEKATRIPMVKHS